MKTENARSQAAQNTSTITSPVPYSLALQSHLVGRSLLREEIIFSDEVLEKHQKEGYIISEKAMKKGKKGWKCGRCGNEAAHKIATSPCARCEKECSYCRHCLMMGRVSSCSVLIRWTGPAVIEQVNAVDWPTFKAKKPLQWNGELSEGQQYASTVVVDAVQKRTELLIWAVCGAGKTEVLFAGINEALLQNLRVCIATPRTDVVLELSPRFQKVFPATTVAALYGGSEDRDKYAALTVSTTHQLLRFDRAFDVVIVDEVDAFPYSYDEHLQYAVRKATKEMATRIYLTATPNRKWQLECHAGKRPFVTIPARFHRHPLPVPTFQWCGNWKKSMEKTRLPRVVEDWVKKRLATNKQSLIFFPNIKLMEKVLPYLMQLHPQIVSVHASDPERQKKVQQFREKKVQVLITTTILERGVTFPDIDVAVVGAEEGIFTEAALVQIAGRVGRSAAYPNGKVTFFHYGRSKAMLQSLVHIVKMNKEAHKKGLLG